MKLPKRTKQHILETKSEKYFINQIPDEWIYDRKTFDYGIDYEVEIFENYQTTGKKFLVQLKSHEKINTENGLIKQIFKVSTLNYYLSLKQEVLIITFNDSKKEADYFLFNKSSLSYLEIHNSKWRSNKTINLFIPVDESTKFHESFSFFSKLDKVLFNKDFNEKQIELQIIKLLCRNPSKKNLALLFSKFLVYTDSELLDETLKHETIFIGASTEVYDKLTTLIYSAEIDMCILAIRCLRHFKNFETLELLVKRYHFLYKEEQNKIADYEKFKKCVYTLLSVFSEFKRVRNKSVLDIFFMEIMDPLTSWTGSHAVKLFLDWWDDLSNEEQTDLTKRIIQAKSNFHSFDPSVNGKVILQHILKNDYNKSLK